MMVVGVSFRPELKASTPQVLFEGSYEEVGRPDTPINYDVTPDGKRFVMLRPYVEASMPSQLIFALEWFDDVRRRALAKPN